MVWNAISSIVGGLGGLFGGGKKETANSAGGGGAASALSGKNRVAHQENLRTQEETAQMEREQLAQTTHLNFLKTGFQAARNISDNLTRAV